MSKFRTIFVTIFQGVEAKNILRTDIFKELMSHQDIRIVFFVGTQEKAEYYRKEFSDPKVIYEVVKPNKSAGFNKFFSNLSFKLLNTETVDLRRKMNLEMYGNYIKYSYDFVVNKILARPWVRKVVRVLDYNLAKDSTFSEYFNRYDPSIVFLAHPFDDLEVNLLKEAKRRGVKTIGFINSWDKLTARNIIRVLPDKLLVFNDIVKEEAKRHADIQGNKIEIVGIPQYDWHINYKSLNRNEFFQEKGFNPNKKLIVYAPMGKAYSNSDWDIINLLKSSIENEEIKNAQLLVRFQPNDFVDFDEIKKRPWLVYDMPGIRFSKERGVDWDMSFDDIRGLSDTLANADLFICYASSLSIDASMFNKPVINIDFEVGGKKPMIKSPTHFYKMTHYINALKIRAVKLVNNKREMIVWINKYLENPELDGDNRKKLVEEQCYVLDGKAGKRTADLIISNLDLP